MKLMTDVTSFVQRSIDDKEISLCGFFYNTLVSN